MNPHQITKSSFRLLLKKCLNVRLSRMQNIKTYATAQKMKE